MNKRAAMTLTELLVSLAIIAVLIALLLPAVQKVRDASARAACANQLRQIGLACHACHDATGAFPPGYSAWPSVDPLHTSPGWGWAAFLLPYLEQGPLFRQIDFNRPIEDPSNTARETVVRLFLCPSDPGVPDTFVIADAAGRDVIRAAPTSYAACYGSGELDEVPGPTEGVFYRNSRIRLTDVTDGTGTTILIGDRAWSHAMAPWAGAVCRGIVRGGPLNAWRTSPEAAYPAPNFPCVQGNYINSTADADGSLDEFFGQHAGGVNMLFADGGVRFLHQAIDRVVLMALATRAGGEVVDPAEY
jgi:prepilin-type N-terminal cleavage/methylation domain-containing protein/prepilin-type processing-associated H-X9-DG protein